jgi:hypothetical protein
MIPAVSFPSCDMEEQILMRCIATLTWAEAECAAAGVPLKKREFISRLFGRKH